ncbi:type II toxin-antitoxin system HicA family toxin [Dechloromonas sp. ARDL1]|uniref:type II toxin-antitoxin system HicA family toxin n=1 Tax=Dechloromonas sp. ARDL1 TaxID=3322121 RepID=UPI003DA6FD83
MRRSPQGRKSDDLVAIALKLGRVRDTRGKEPTYIREHDPQLSPPLSIPSHGAKDMKTGTAKNIIDMLLDDVSNWEVHFLEMDDENDHDE